MTTFKTLLGTTAVAAALFSPFAASAELSDNNTVYDYRGNVVRSMVHGTCVRTQWNVGTDVCAPPREEAKVTPPAPRTTIAKEQGMVYFNFDQATLTPAAQEQLNQVATILRNAKDVRRANIVGYADRMGDSQYNVNLSQKRANAVAAYLNQQGYLNTNVTAVRGLGESNSKTRCGEDLQREEKIACLSADRRVEIEVEYLQQPTTAYNR
jgi:outer membrane protein OmpA-like peptidoglycan-associated protein